MNRQCLSEINKKLSSVQPDCLANSFCTNKGKIMKKSSNLMGVKLSGGCQCGDSGLPCTTSNDCPSSYCINYDNDEKECCSSGTCVNGTCNNGYCQ